MSRYLLVSVVAYDIDTYTDDSKIYRCMVDADMKYLRDLALREPINVNQYIKSKLVYHSRNSLLALLAPSFPALVKSLNILYFALSFKYVLIDFETLEYGRLKDKDLRLIRQVLY